MKRSTAAYACIYQYGALAPITNAEVVRDQLLAGHRFGNKLREIEQERRKLNEINLVRLFPEVGRLYDIAEKAKVAKNAKEAEIKAKKAKERTTKISEEDSEAFRELKKAAAAAWAAHSDVRTPAYRSETFKNDPETLAIAERTKALQKQAYAESPAFWGTKVAVIKSLEQMHKGAPPQFQRWSGNGRLAVQLQRVTKTIKQGLPANELPLGRCKLVKMLAVPPEAFSRKKKFFPLQYSQVTLRVGTDENGQPITAIFPIRIHKPFPPDAVIKWIYVHMRTYGTQTRWYVSFSLTTTAPVRKPRAAEGHDTTVGVDVGWRLTERGLRVATWKSTAPINRQLVEKLAADSACDYWVDAEGTSGMLVLPAERISAWPHIDGLISTRDRVFNEIKEQLLAWIQGPAPKTLPEWFAERTKHLHLSRSPSRLFALVMYWKENRFHGDDVIFGAMTQWAETDAHIYDWYANKRRKMLNWRDKTYRCFAKTLAESFGQAAVEAIDWAALQKTPGIDQKPTPHAVKVYKRISAVGRLISYIDEIMPTVYTKAKMTTQRCNACGKVEKFDTNADVIHVCSHCGESWDQDDNAAGNLRDQATGVLEEVA